MLEQRVAPLEEDMKEVKSTLKGIEAAVLEIRTELKHVPKMTDHAALKSEGRRDQGTHVSDADPAPARRSCDHHLVRRGGDRVHIAQGRAVMIVRAASNRSEETHG